MDASADTNEDQPTPRMLAWAKNSAAYRLAKRMMTERELSDAIKRKARSKFDEISEAQVNALAEAALAFGRSMKALERALVAAKAMPPGMLAVPGQGARLDRHGNVDRGQIVQVLSQLRITMTAGYTRNMSRDPRAAIRAQQRAGGRFFVAKPGGRLHAGVYQRELLGRNITPVFLFVRSAHYKVRLPVDEVARRVIDARLHTNFATAWQQAMATARRS